MFLFHLVEKLFFFRPHSGLFFDISSIFWFCRWLFWLFSVLLQELSPLRILHSAFAQYFWNILENFVYSLILSGFLILDLPTLV